MDEVYPSETFVYNHKIVRTTTQKSAFWIHISSSYPVSVYVFVWLCQCML
jgi:hypothetical protein